MNLSIRNMSFPTATYSKTLADQGTSKMTQGPGDRNAAWQKQYMESLINPFSMAIKSPKLLDGEIKTTAGIKLRATGEIICSATLNTNVILFPGLTNVICYCVAPDGNDNSAAALTTPLTDPVLIDGTIFKQHLSTPQDRSVVRLARLTGAGARFFLTNSAEEDDGYWEACRVTNHSTARDLFFKSDTSGASIGAGLLKALSNDYDLANNNTYQFGTLRDIHKYIFKLNSEDNDHKFSAVNGLNTSETTANMTSALADMDQWDMIFIKIRGRRNPLSPSVLRFDTVANQELVYAESSPLSRMMDETIRDPKIEGYLEYSRIDMPAFQAVP